MVHWIKAYLHKVHSTYCTIDSVLYAESCQWVQKLLVVLIWQSLSLFLPQTAVMCLLVLYLHQAAEAVGSIISLPQICMWENSWLLHWLFYVMIFVWCLHLHLERTVWESFFFLWTAYVLYCIIYMNHHVKTVGADTRTRQLCWRSGNLGGLGGNSSSCFLRHSWTMGAVYWGETTATGHRRDTHCLQDGGRSSFCYAAHIKPFQTFSFPAICTFSVLVWVWCALVKVVTYCTLSVIYLDLWVCCWFSNSLLSLVYAWGQMPTLTTLSVFWRNLLVVSDWLNLWYYTLV